MTHGILPHHFHTVIIRTSHLLLPRSSRVVHGMETMIKDLRFPFSYIRSRYPFARHSISSSLTTYRLEEDICTVNMEEKNLFLKHRKYSMNPFPPRPWPTLHNTNAFIIDSDRLIFSFQSFSFSEYAVVLFVPRNSPLNTLPPSGGTILFFLSTPASISASD